MSAVIRPAHFVIEQTGWLGASLYRMALEDCRVSFESSGCYAKSLRPEGLVDAGRIQRFADALKLLGVVDWRESYLPQDSVIDDGEQWQFEGSILGIQYASKGSNAYPAFSAPKVPALTRDRWSLLIEAAEICFFSDLPFGG